jgi:hypothetical protein
MQLITAADRTRDGKAMTISDEALAGLVTVAMIPRDTFVMSNQVLDRLVETTPEGVAVIVADTGASPGPRAHMEEVCKKHGYTLLRSRSMATPSQARNAVIDLW